MPFPWKKSRVPRISRIVADLQSRKHGNSLVLETGFPTSLVDLFVKNRDKLKRPFKSKKHKVQDQCLVEEEEIVVSDPVIVTNSRELGDVLEKNQTLGEGNLEEERKKYCGFKLVSQGHGNLAGSHVDKVVQDSVHGVREGENEKEIRKVRLVCVLTGIVMFMVVILGLSLKKLAVAITISAFLFIFLEHVGDFVSCWSERRPNAGLIQRLFCFFPSRTVVPISKEVKSSRHSEKQIIVQEEDYFSSHSCDMFAPDGGFHCCGDEIQVLEGMVSQVEENKNMENNLDSLIRDKKLGYLQAMKKKRVLEVEGNGTAVLVSTNAKIKTKMRKLVRNGKKWRRNKVKESYANNNGGGCLLEADQIVGQKGLEDAGKSLGFSLAEGKETERERIEVGDEVEAEAEAEAEMVAVVEKRMAIQRKDNNSSYLTFIIIILGGLLEGRMLAFSLTVAWWMALKLVLRYRKCVN